jgi:hypothetical protein
LKIALSAEMGRSNEGTRHCFQIGSDDIQEIERLAYSGHWDKIISIIENEPETAFISRFDNVELVHRVDDNIFEIESLAYSGRWDEIINIIEDDQELVSCVFGEAETTLLISISCFDNVELVRYLLSRGANPNYIDRAGQSALLSTIWGAVEGRNTLPVARVLIEFGANPDLLVQSGCTVIDVAKLNELGEYIALFRG